MPEPGRLADDIDRAANSVGGYVEIRMEPPMPDTPTLRDAAEAHFDAYMAWVEGGLRNDDEALRPLCDTADTLRAALSAEEAWRARAEAAIVVMEAERLVTALLQTNVANMGRQQREEMDVRLDNARLSAMAARRRYEETCRAG